MNEEQRQEWLNRQCAGMRAQSKAEIEARAIEQAAGMRDSGMSGEAMRGAAQNMNVWGECRNIGGSLPPITWRQRFRNWLGAYGFRPLVI